MSYRSSLSGTTLVRVVPESLKRFLRPCAAVLDPYGRRHCA
jgi:hypothetical protein